MPKQVQIAEYIRTRFTFLPDTAVARLTTMIVSQMSLGSRRALLSRAWNHHRTKSTAVASLSSDDLHQPQHPTLKHVPSLPIVGSLIKPYSNVPHGLDPAFTYKTWPELSQQYGEFYTLGIPGTLYC